MPPVSKLVFMTTVWFVRHRYLAALAVIAALSIPAYLAWETRHAIRQARDRTESASNLPVAIRPLDRSLPADVETVGAQSAFRDAALFHGHLFVAGPHGLVEYDANGAVVRRFRTGLELPPSGLVGLTVGVLAAASEPELLIATAADGLLTFDGRRMLHVRPDRPEQRKLTALLALSSGRLLLGTDTSGLLAFDGRRLTPAHPELAGVAVTALAGADADVWIGTLDRGVWHWRAGGVDRFDESRGLPDPRVLSIATHGDRAYVGTALGVAEFQGGRYVAHARLRPVRPGRRRAARHAARRHARRDARGDSARRSIVPRRATDPARRARSDRALRRGRRHVVRAGGGRAVRRWTIGPAACVASSARTQAG